MPGFEIQIKCYFRWWNLISFTVVEIPLPLPINFITFELEGGKIIKTTEIGIRLVNSSDLNLLIRIKNDNGYNWLTEVDVLPWISLKYNFNWKWDEASELSSMLWIPFDLWFSYSLAFLISTEKQDRHTRFPRFNHALLLLLYLPLFLSESYFLWRRGYFHIVFLLCSNNFLERQESLVWIFKCCVLQWRAAEWGWCSEVVMMQAREDATLNIPDSSQFPRRLNMGNIVECWCYICLRNIRWELANYSSTTSSVSSVTIM